MAADEMAPAPGLRRVGGTIAINTPWSMPPYIKKNVPSEIYNSARTPQGGEQTQTTRVRPESRLPCLCFSTSNQALADNAVGVIVLLEVNLSLSPRNNKTHNNTSDQAIGVNTTTVYVVVALLEVNPFLNPRPSKGKTSWMHARRHSICLRHLGQKNRHECVPPVSGGGSALHAVLPEPQKRQRFYTSV